MVTRLSARIVTARRIRWWTTGDGMSPVHKTNLANTCGMSSAVFQAFLVARLASHLDAPQQQRSSLIRADLA
jgi:hypothetical protein